MSNLHSKPTNRKSFHFIHSSMLHLPSVSTCIVLDRRLGCADESATDEEQGEKILYYYPPNITLDQQVSVMIDFSLFNI